jgi:hypothetical protein
LKVESLRQLETMHDQSKKLPQISKNMLESSVFFIFKDSESLFFGKFK